MKKEHARDYLTIISLVSVVVVLALSIAEWSTDSQKGVSTPMLFKVIAVSPVVAFAVWLLYVVYSAIWGED